MNISDIREAVERATSHMTEREAMRVERTLYLHMLDFAIAEIGKLDPLSRYAFALSMSQEAPHIVQMYDSIIHARTA